MKQRTRIGSWRTREGNGVDAYIIAPGDDPFRHLLLAWDSPPPLSDGDLADYLTVILPALITRAQEYLERPGRALAVVLR